MTDAACFPEAGQVRELIKRLRTQRQDGQPVEYREPLAAWVFRNNSSTSGVPPFGCMKVINAEKTAAGRWRLVIDEPDGSGGIFIFNNGYPVPAGGKGVAQLSVNVTAAYSGGPPVNGNVWGASGWLLTATGTDSPVKVMGVVDATKNYLRGQLQLGGGTLAQAVTPAGGIGPSTWTGTNWTYTGEDCVPILDDGSLGTGQTVNIKNPSHKQAIRGDWPIHYDEKPDGTLVAVVEPCDIAEGGGPGVTNP